MASDIIYLDEEGCVRRFAWWPVRLDGGRLAGRIIWLRRFYSRPHAEGFWRPVWSIEERPGRYVDGRTIRIVGEAIWCAG